MRILMTADAVGGVWTFARELISGLLTKADVSVFLVTVGPLPSAQQMAALHEMQAEMPGFAFECLDGALEWQQDNADTYSRYEKRLLDRITSFRPDLIHSNQFCFGALPVSTPKLLVAHSDVLSWHRAVRGGDAPESPWLQRYLSLVRAGLAGAAMVVAPTYAMLHDLEAGFGAQPRGRVVSNGRDVRPEKGHRKLQAVAAGRVWDAAKGMSVLEDLYSPMPILIAGDTANSDGSYDAARLRRCVLVGLLPEEQLLNLFTESSVYIATSVYEPFGLGPVEAALCGCAVLARDIPSFREVWGDAASYFHDAASLRSGLQAFAKDEMLLTRARKSSYQRAKTRYTCAAMTESYLQLYNEVLTGAAGAQHTTTHV